MSWVNRIKRVREYVPGLFGNTSAWRIAVQRTSNAYSFNDQRRHRLSLLFRLGPLLRAQEVGELLQEATRRVSEAIEVDLIKVLEPIANGQELLVRAGVNKNPGGRRAGDDTR